jgi:hypothetical protein
MSAAWVLLGMFVAIGGLAIAGVRARRRRAERAASRAMVYGSAESSSWHANGTPDGPCDGGSGNSSDSGSGGCGGGGD